MHPGAAALDRQQDMQSHVLVAQHQVRPDRARDANPVLPQGHSAFADADVLGDHGVAALGVDKICGSGEHASALLSVRSADKPHLTRGKITIGKIGGMETDWSTATEDWERVRWARAHAGFPTARAAAESLNLGENTYSAYERPPGASKTTRLRDQRAIQFGRKFKVSWRWLLLGEGTPFDEVRSVAQERVLAAMATADEAQQERVAAAVEALLRTG